MICTHTVTRGREGETGSWCRACGVKVYAVDERQCGDCARHVRLISGSICQCHGMVVVPSMNVTYRITEGSCFEPKVEVGAAPAHPGEGEKP